MSGSSFFSSILPQTDAKIQSYRKAKGQIRIPGEGLQGRLSAVKKDSRDWWCESGWHAQKSLDLSPRINREWWHTHMVLELQRSEVQGHPLLPSMLETILGQVKTLYQEIYLVGALWVFIRGRSLVLASRIRE